MFGLKWLWKSNKQNIDTSNFVSKDFLTTTLTDYVLNNSLNTTLSNYLTTNTTQTITGAKTFNNNVVISKNPTPLVLKANNNEKTYMLIKGSDNTTNFSLGANSTDTSLEVNRGNLTIKTLEANKNVNFENIARVKFKRSVLEMGTEINAGFGGGEVKFIPENNSTKTLKFYNNQPNDTRKFKLLVPEPTEAQNPATKQYVDQQITNVRGEIDNEVMLNYVSLSGQQTITGEKTFTKNLYLAKDNPVLVIKSTNNSNAELTMRILNSGVFNISSNNTKTSINALGGANLELVAEANSAIVEFKTNRVKLGNSILEAGTEINAGYGGTTVKFIPEGNSTKTLQFYNSSNTDTRRFNLLVPEPTTGNNPATKAYVDNLIQKRDYTFNANSTPTRQGEQYVYSLYVSDLQETTIVGVNVSFKDNANAEAKSLHWNVSWNTTWGPKLYIRLFIDQHAYNAYNNKNDINLDWTKISIRVFYIPKYNSRESEKVYEGEVVNLSEVLGGK